MSENILTTANSFIYFQKHSLSLSTRIYLTSHYLFCGGHFIFFTYRFVQHQNVHVKIYLKYYLALRFRELLLQPAIVLIDACVVLNFFFSATKTTAILKNIFHLRRASCARQHDARSGMHELVES